MDRERPDPSVIRRQGRRAGRGVRGRGYIRIRGVRPAWPGRAVRAARRRGGDQQGIWRPDRHRPWGPPPRSPYRARVPCRGGGGRPRPAARTRAGAVRRSGAKTACRHWHPSRSGAGSHRAPRSRTGSRSRAPTTSCRKINGSMAEYGKPG